MKKIFVVILCFVILGCSSFSMIAPTPTAAITPIPSPVFPPPPPPAQTSLIKFIQTIQVTPDDQFLTGGFARIHYIPATDRFVVLFGGKLAKPSGKCMEGGNSYKEYTTDMQETGKSGTFACEPLDEGSLMVDNTLYFAIIHREAEKDGWHLLKIDATDWTTLIDKFYALDSPMDNPMDPMLVFVNGQLDISSQYTLKGEPPNPDTPAGDYGTHHNFFSLDLEPQGKIILTEPPHVNGSYMVYVEGIYYLVTSNTFDGDVLVAKYDQDWKYLGGKTLIKQAHFSTGLVYDNQRFYLAYTDTSQRFGPTIPPVSLNIRLAVFDREWNLLDNVAVTSYMPQDGRQPGRPWVILHGNRLYVSYDLDIVDPATHVEKMQWQANVSVYELTQAAP
jgi:hypothetical protein